MLGWSFTGGVRPPPHYNTHGSTLHNTLQHTYTVAVLDVWVSLALDERVHTSHVPVARGVVHCRVTVRPTDFVDTRALLYQCYTPAVVAVFCRETQHFVPVYVQFLPDTGTHKHTCCMWKVCECVRACVRVRALSRFLYLRAASTCHRCTC